MDDEKKEETKENKKIKLDNTPYKIIEAIINKLTKKRLFMMKKQKIN